jgi:hypothetical protein
MYCYELWVRITPYQTVNVRVWADNDFQAKMIGEAQYGSGQVLNYTRING